MIMGYQYIRRESSSWFNRQDALTSSKIENRLSDENVRTQNFLRT